MKNISKSSNCRSVPKKDQRSEKASFRHY